MSITIIRPALPGPANIPFPAWQAARPVSVPFPIAGPLAARALTRLIPYVGAAYLAYEIYEAWKDGLFSPNVITGPDVAGYRLTGYCHASTPAPAVPAGWGTRLVGMASCGQANNATSITNVSGTPTAFAITEHTAPAYFNVAGATAFQPRAVYARVGTAAQTPALPVGGFVTGRIPVVVPGAAVPPMVNPNVLRGLPGAMPFAPPAVSPLSAESPWVEQEWTSETPYRPPLVRIPQRVPHAWQWTTPGTSAGATPNFPPRPPRSNEKEKKVRRAPTTKGARFGYALYRAVDRISENAELVDAMYDALPDDVKKRWEKGRKKRGPVDSFGQYGVDGADWKLQALWHNWHKMDAVEAVKNIVKNQLEDTIIGNINRQLPKQVGNAFTREITKDTKLSPEQFVSKKVDQLFDALYGD